MSGTARTSTVHFSRIARRLSHETGVGYQKALSTVRSESDRITRPGPRLDAPRGWTCAPMWDQAVMVLGRGEPVRRDQALLAEHAPGPGSGISFAVARP